MVDGNQDLPVRPDPGMVKAWADYAKARFASADTRITEYRGWARQLIAAIGVVIGLEVTIVARLALDTTLTLARELRGISLALLLVPLAVQVLILRRLLHVGYRGEHLLGPEAPTKLADYLAEKDEVETQRVIGAYYAKSFDHFHTLAERLGKQVGAATTCFQRTLPPVLLGVAILAIGALWYPLPSDTHSSMANEPASTGPRPAKPDPPSNAGPADRPVPNTNPLVVTPTPGQTETHGANSAGNTRSG
jgi:hypothetical protein